MFTFKKNARRKLISLFLFTGLGITFEAQGADRTNHGVFISASPYSGAGKIDEKKSVNYLGGFAASATYWVINRPSFRIGPQGSAEATFFGARSEVGGQGAKGASSLSAQFASVGASAQYRNFLGFAHLGISGMVGRGVGTSQFVLSNGRSSDFTEYSLDDLPVKTRKITVGTDFDLGEDVALSLNLFRSSLVFDLKGREGKVTESQTAEDGNVYALAGRFDADSKSDYFPREQSANLYGISVGVGVNL